MTLQPSIHVYYSASMCSSRAIGYRLKDPSGARATEPKPCDGSTSPIGSRSANLGTSEALDAGFRPLLLVRRLLLLCRNADTAQVITRTLAHQNSLERPARRRRHKADGVVHSSRSQETDHPCDREASFPGRRYVDCAGCSDEAGLTRKLAECELIYKTNRIDLRKDGQTARPQAANARQFKPFVNQ
jgi:hypothetical protein